MSSSPQKADSSKTAPMAAPHPVLVVEDNPVMCQILTKLLSRMGVAYEISPNGKDAVDGATITDYSLILMDIMMPDMDGIEAARKIRQLPGKRGEVPIIAVSGNHDPDDIAQYDAVGMNGHIKKPVGQFALREILVEHLGINLKQASTESIPGDLRAALEAEDELDVLNWETLKEYGAILKGKLPVLLRDYLRAGPDLVSDIGDAVLEKDTETLRFLAHKLKSTSLIFGAESVSELAAKLEIMARSGEMADAQAVYGEMFICYERTQTVLRKKLTLMKNLG